MRIKSLRIAGGSHLELKGFNVVIGANGVGKSTLLREIFHRGTDRQLNRYRWIDSVEFETPNLAGDIDLLVGSLSKRIDESNPSNTRYSSRALRGYSGDFPSDADIGSGHLDELQRAKNGEINGFELHANVAYRKPFISAHTCENRLGVPDRVGLTTISQPAQDAINVLWRHPEMLASVSSNVRERFQQDLLVLDHRGSELELGLSAGVPPSSVGSQDKQEHFLDVEQWKAREFSRLQECGHGVRAMTHLLLSLYEPVHSIILIDEPELHLYPAQKIALGRLLVEVSKKQNKQVVLVTHDASLLQGVLDSGSETLIVRLAGSGAATDRSIFKCDLSVDAEVSPKKNQREYLNALFHNYCIAVEGASDRAFYQGVFELTKLSHEGDFGFVVASGKSGFVNICSLTESTSVRTAVLGDFDLLLPSQRGILEKIAAIRGVDLPLGDVDAVCEALVSRNVNPEKQLKKHGLGLSALTQEERSKLQLVIDVCQQEGVFVVPSGELESLCPSIEGKARFAEEALCAFEIDGAKMANADVLCRAVVKWLRTENHAVVVETEAEVA